MVGLGIDRAMQTHILINAPVSFFESCQSMKIFRPSPTGTVGLFI